MATGADRFDVLRYSDDTYEIVPVGDGERIIEAHKSEARRRRWIATLTTAVALTVVVAAAGSLFLNIILLSSIGGLVFGVGGGVVRYRYWDHSKFIPDLVESGVAAQTAQSYDSEFDSDRPTDPSE